MDGDRQTRAAPVPTGASWPRAAAGYGLAALLSILLVAGCLRLWEADLDIPFTYRVDALLNELWIKTLIERGWYLHSDAVGAPNGLDMHDFPLVDSLFFAILKLVALVSGAAEAGARGVGRTINLYYLLSFPLTTLTALATLRRLGIRYGPALVAALLMAFLPYHFFRGQSHLFLASYFLVPPTVGVLLRVYLGDDFPTPTVGRSGPWWDGLICLLVSCGGIYYAFFSCYFLMVAGLGAGLGRRRPGVFRRVGLLVLIIGVGVAANLLPKLSYDRGHGANTSAVVRDAGESEVYGLRLIQLLAPLAGHRLAPLAALRATLDRALPQINESEACYAALGVVGSLGFVLLLLRPLLRRRPTGRRPDPLEALTVLNLAALLLAVVGGFGTIFNALVRPEIRCYNRISVFIGCFALTALAFLASDLMARLRRPRARLAAGVALGGVLILGVLDQTIPSFVPDYDHLARAFASDAEFVGRIEAALPPGSMVFQLPSIGFPEQPDTHGMGGYDHFRCYLHSRQLRWSHGTMKGRPGETWRTWLNRQAPEDLVEALALVGFGGIYVDRDGYSDRGAEVEGQLARVLGTGPTLVNREESRSFFNLGAYAAALRDRLGAEAWAQRRQEALYPITYTLGRGCFGEERPPGKTFTWSERTSELILTNTGPRPRWVRLALRLVPGWPDPAHVQIRGPLWSETLVVDGHGKELTRDLVLMPGRSKIRFECDARAADIHGRVFRLEDYSVEVRALPTGPVFSRVPRGRS